MQQQDMAKRKVLVSSKVKMEMNIEENAKANKMTAENCEAKQQNKNM